VEVGPDGKENTEEDVKYQKGFVLPSPKPRSGENCHDGNGNGSNNTPNPGSRLDPHSILVGLNSEYKEQNGVENCLAHCDVARPAVKHKKS